ncbi:MAG: tetratricopeptide repeat protein, partial [Bacteroidetes bacterium]|nr:tetratricopeptide repeat protein [Bacteroidota bacterium]
PEYNELDKAKEAIDLAAQHPKTQGQAKTWYYRGLVYHKLFQTKDEKFKNLDSNPLKEAFLSYVKAKDLDVKKRYEKDILFKLTVAGTEFFNKGSMEYEQKKFEESLESFETVLELGRLPYINQVDTGAFFNAAIAADQAGLTQKALSYYEKSVELKYGGSDVYHYIASLYLSLGDTVKAITTYTDGIAAYPDNSIYLYIQLINHYLGEKELDKAAEFIRPAVEKDPENFSLWNVYGLAFEDSNLDEAIIGYTKAIELNPEFFDPYYNLGTIYFNQGVEANNEAMNIPLSDEEGYKAAIEKRDKLFDQALPHYEKAHEIDGNYGDVLVALKEIYYRKQMNDKLEEVTKKINDLK